MTVNKNQIALAYSIVYKKLLIYNGEVQLNSHIQSINPCVD